MDEERKVEKVWDLGLSGTQKVPGEMIVTPQPGRAAARAGRAAPRPEVTLDLESRVEFSEVPPARPAADLRAFRVEASPSILGKAFGLGPLNGVPVSWLLAGDLLAVGSLVAGCTVTALVLGPVGLLATVGMEAVAYAGGLLISQSTVPDVEKAHRKQLLETQDPETGLPDRPAMLRILHDEFQSARSSGTPLSLMLIHADPWGDAPVEDVLRAVASRANSALREGDSLGLHGADQLVAVIPGLGSGPATLVAERIRLSVASAPVAVNGVPLEVTVSIGLASTELAQLAELPALVRRAGQALHRAGIRGGNRVVVSGAATGAAGGP